MEFYDIVGSFGPWQRRLFLILLSVNVMGIWQNFSITFLAPNMDFHCIEPLQLQTNESEMVFVSDDQCQVLQENISAPCTKWEYNISQTSQTIVSEWDLVCDREWLISLAKSVYMVGFLLSVIFFGQLSDCVGRFPTLIICYIIASTSMFLSLLSTSYMMFIILRFFQAFGRSGITTVGYVLIMETVGPKHRAEAGVAIHLGWSIGFVTLAGLAWFVRNWFWFQLVLSLCFVPYVFFYSFIPESPRWLAMRGKTKQLEKLLEKAASVNGKEIKGDIRDFEIFQHRKETEGKKPATFLALMKLPKMRCRTLKMIYLWMVNAFLYYGLSYNTNDLAGNPYLNFFIAGIVELPCRALVFFSIKKWGRRPTIVSFMAVLGLAYGAMLLVPADLPWLGTSFAMLGKFCVTGSFGLLYLYTTELFPTVVRNVALGSCSMFARIGSILAPFVRELKISEKSFNRKKEWQLTEG
ncbi:organic cation transporter protein [Trichonephila clavata]|uniref:Organic cation transporter protein n=1 Tax=Trichonephila clavata TaxID=2740835 RepID=A0A8X6KTP4_TRICU|nr:organic cation transporter protein [Trichonephila clavata]